jgi:hypothetical protein
MKALQPASVLAWAVVAACAPTPETATPGASALASPAGPFSGEPFLHTDARDRVHMTWIEKTSDSTHAVRYARLDGDAWTPPSTVTERGDFFVNWADFPAVTTTTSGRLFVHWLQRSGKGRYAYDIRFAQSPDEGHSWHGGEILHRDGREAEHGFVALWSAPGDSVGAAWLDGRAMGGDHDGEPRGAMQVMSTVTSATGERPAERPLDSRTCECCQVNAALAARGPVVVYRDRSKSEIRDIAIVRYVDGAWTSPVIVHNDGWQVAACPVNGPAVAANGDTVAVAWFTGAQDTARVRLAWSTDGGASFHAPVRADEGAPAGRVDLELLSDGTAALSWLERVDSTSARVLLRRVTPSGKLLAPVVVATTNGSRASGFPKITRRSSDLVAAWTMPGDTARIHMARVNLTNLP